ncbi:ROK family protein [Litoribacillus peritrichatus]|uniref:Fructokinase n=1 Tax=Litoribacillus peritrichatus TaxID=718191 RepID=A0ABP7MBB6_9GAMM
MKIGIDLGGTKIECVVISDNHEIVHRERCDTPKGNYQGILTAIAQLVHNTEHLTPSGTPVGVGIPGTLSEATGVVKNANSVCLIGNPLDKDLSERLQRPVRLANDANCFAWSEYCDGAASGAKSVFGVILGTGVGGGIVANNGLINGSNGIAGEWGHNPLTHYLLESRKCYCGKQDCIETYLSGPAFEADYRQQHQQDLPAKQIIQNMRSGDMIAKAHFLDYAKKLAASLTGVVNILDPEIIVLGGGMSNIDELYEVLPELLNHYVFSDTINTQIVKARHGDSSGVRGAAWLWD